MKTKMFRIWVLSISQRSRVHEVKFTVTPSCRKLTLRLNCSVMKVTLRTWFQANGALKQFFRPWKESNEQRCSRVYARPMSRAQLQRSSLPWTPLQTFIWRSESRACQRWQVPWASASQVWTPRWATFHYMEWILWSLLHWSSFEWMLSSAKSLKRPMQVCR